MHPDVTCDRCGRVFPDDSEGTDDLCGDCYTEVYCFVCAWCDEYGDVADQHAYVAVFEAWEAGVPLPGLYRVTGVPYYSCSMLGGGMLFRSCVQWLGFLPAMDDEGYACGNLCQGCQTRALAWIADHHRDCAIVAACRGC